MTIRSFSMFRQRAGRQVSRSSKLLPHQAAQSDKPQKVMRLSRRKMIGAGILTCAGVTRLKKARAAPFDGRVDPPNVISTPPRLWGPQAPVSYTPDPDIISLDRSFDTLIYGNASLELVWRASTSQDTRWLEGPAWCSEGRFLLLSDVVGSTQYRFMPQEREMTVFRQQSYHSNGNTFDREGRLLTCEHDLRRVIRWEHDGRCTILADTYKGQRLNSPNDIVVGPDGGVWFTDPPYGDRLLEGHPDAPPSNNAGLETLKWNLDAEVVTEIGGRIKQSAHVFHVDPTSRELTAVLTEADVKGPNGLCFSPNGKTLYITSSETATARGGQGGHYNIYAFDVDGRTLRNQRVFSNMTLKTQKLMPDGIKMDVAGNLWVGTSGPLGLGGVLVYNPAGTLIGRLRLPRSVSNLAFGGTQRNRLFMCAKDTIFALDLAVQGAGYA